MISKTLQTWLNACGRAGTSPWRRSARSCSVTQVSHVHTGDCDPSQCEVHRSLRFCRKQVQVVLSSVLCTLPLKREGGAV